uniref:Importin N-terminal domain-containing protein n=1 Tax=Glossina pallidipes TaxID=7398 RepID=A0A1B0ABT5_GLOPL
MDLLTPYPNAPTEMSYVVYLSELIVNQSFDLPLRQIACVMLTRYVENHWGERDGEGNPSEAGSCGLVATDQAKHTIRKILPNGLYDPNSKIRSLVAHTISTIAATDWPSDWTELFDIIIKCLGVLTFLVTGMSKYIQSYMERILPVIWQLLTQIADTYVKVIVNQTKEVLSRVLSVLANFAEKVAGNEFWWKIQEACMVAVQAYNELFR